MDMKQIKELLANADVRQILEEQIQTAVKDSKQSLDEEKAALTEQKKSFEKEAFLFRKTVLAKSHLYESKLKEYYEAKFNEAKKKLGKDVYEFINESVKKLTKAVEEDVKASTPAVKIQEAFSKAVREMAPFINVNELADKNQSVIDDLKQKLNESLKRTRIAEGKAFTGELHSLVVSECSGYPTEKVALLYETVLQLEPKNLIEGKQALDAAKQALKTKEAEIAQKVQAANVVTESVKPAAPAAPASTQRAKLKVIAEDINTKKKEVKVVAEANEVTALDYDIFLG